MSDNKNKFITCAMICFIVLDFLRMAVANLYKLYDFSLVFLALLTAVFSIINYRNIIKNKFLLIATCFVGYISIIEFAHGGINNIKVIYENIIWVLLPMNFILCVDRKNIKIVLMIYVLLNSILSIPSVLNHFVDMPGMTVAGDVFINDPGYYGGRNANGMINAMCLLVLFVLTKIIESKFVNYMLYGISVFCFLNVVLSGSRGAQLAILLVLFTFFITKVKNKKNAAYGAVGLGLSTVFILMFREKDRLFSAGNIERLLDVVTSYRYSVWTEAVKIVNKVNVMFGCGTNSIQENAFVYIGPTSNIVAQGTAINNCHNILINILYNDGIVALLIFIYLLYVYVKQVLRNKNKEILPFVGVVICGFVIALLDIPLLYSASYINIIWWLFVFYTVSEA